MLATVEPLRKRDSHLWARDPHDWYVEPEWCSERLFAVEKFQGTIWDPACGTGRIVRAARAAGNYADGADLIARGEFLGGFDFMEGAYERRANIVCNPPFKIAVKFVQRALYVTEHKTAMLLPANWVQGDKRARWLETTPLRRVLFITPRPSMPPGAAVEAGMKAGGGKVDFAWFIWLRGYDGKPELGWLRRDA